MKKDYLFLFLIILIGIIFSFPFWWQGKIPFSSTYLVNNFPPWQYYYGLPVKNAAMPDVGSQIFPWRYLSIKSWQNGEIPWWNPYNFAGTPLLANFQSASFHPGNFLFFILPILDAWSVLVLLPPVLASLFTFLYLREIKVSPVSALVASLAFGFCGFIVCWLAYGTLPWAILWLPLALFAIEKFMKGFWWSGLLLSFSLVFSLFSGHFQTSLYLLLAVFLYILTHSKRLPLLIFALLGLCLALPQLLPTWEFYQQSVRSESFRVGEAIPLKYLITLLAPDFFGNPVTRNDWFGHYAEWAGFIGVLPLILAIYALFFGIKNFFLKFFAFLGIFSLLTAVRSPFQELIVNLRIPVLSTSAFSRIIVLFSFSMAVLSAFGFEQVKKDWEEKRWKRSLLFLFSFGLVILLTWGWIFARPQPHSYIAKRNFILPSLMLTASAFCFLTGFIKRGWWRNLVVLGLFCLVAFDLLRFAKKWMPFDPREYFYPELEVLKFLQEKTAKGERVFGNFGGELNVFAVGGIEGYDPLFIKRYGELITAASEGKIERPAVSTVYINKNGKFSYKILNLLGVKYLLHAKEDDHYVWAFPFWQFPESFELVWEDEKYQVFFNKRALPRAFLAYDYQVEKDDQGIIDLILAEETDLRKTVVLEEEPQIAIEPCNDEAVKEDKVAILKYTPNQVELKVESTCPALLFLSDNFYPGWRALIDGQKTKIYRGDYSFRAIVVPEGNHTVKFSYSL